MQTATTKYKPVGAGVVWGWVGYLSFTGRFFGEQARKEKRGTKVKGEIPF